MPHQKIHRLLVELFDVLVEPGVGAVLENQQLRILDVLRHPVGEAGRADHVVLAEGYEGGRLYLA